MFPQPIRKHPRGERIFTRDQPKSQIEPVERTAREIRLRKIRGERRFHDLTGLVHPVAARQYAHRASHGRGLRHETMRHRIHECLLRAFGLCKSIELAARHRTHLRAKVRLHRLLVLRRALRRNFLQRRGDFTGRIVLGSGRARLLIGLPGCLRRVNVRRQRSDIFPRGGDDLPQLREPRRLLRRRHEHPFLAPANQGLLHIGEKGTERIEIPRREGIEFVIVALRAAGRLPEPRRADRAHAVGHHARLVIFRLRPTLFGREQQPVKSRADTRLHTRIGQQIAGNLLERKTVKAFVRIETLDHPVAIRPNIARVVAVIADGVGKPHEIEPAHGHALTIAGIGQQPIDQSRISIRGRVGHKRRHLRGRGGQPNQIRRQTPNERAPIRFG